MKFSDDPYVRELLPEFVDTWLSDLDSKFKGLIEAKATDDLYRFGHTLKGSCFQFGLDDIAQLGIELMDYAKKNDWNNALQMEDKIRKALLDVKQYLETSSL